MKTQEIIRLFKNPSVLDEAFLSQTEQLVKDYPWFAGGWVIYAKNLKNAGRKSFLTALNRAALMSADRKWLKNFMEGEGILEKTTSVAEEYHIPEYPPGETGSASGEKTEKIRLIEDFLEKGARFKSFTEEESGGKTVDLAEKAVTITDEIVTERFANILVRQKKFTEALEAYQKLSLKYPEKIIYFAARIQEVKDLMNINN